MNLMKQQLTSHHLLIFVLVTIFLLLLQKQT